MTVSRFLDDLTAQVLLTSFSNKDLDTPFAAEGRELASLLKRKAADEEIQTVIEKIHSLAIDASLDPFVTSTDIFVTAVLHVGNKSLSHVLAAIERTKDRLLDAGAASESARAQIITAVMSYWSSHPGVAISIVEKLLNYSILTPSVVINWALISYAGATQGAALSQSHIYEMVFHTVLKVTSRVRQVVHKAAAADAAQMEVDGGADAAREELAATRDLEVKAMRDLFKSIDDALVSWASGTKDEQMEVGDNTGDRDRLIRRWGEKWLRVFRRKAAIEEAFVVETGKVKNGVDGAA
jgi:nuclear cap-binding protein subunit 1